MKPQKPKIMLNMAATIDGKTVRPDGRWHGLSSANDKNKMSRIRNKSDFIIMGLNSLINDNDDLWLPEQPDNSQKKPVPVIISRSRIPDPKLNIFQAPNQKKPLVFLNQEIFQSGYTGILNKDSLLIDKFSSLKLLVNLCEIFILSIDSLDPKSIIKQLYQRGGRRILLEGGPTLNYSFFKYDQIDTIYLTLVPFIIGMDHLYGICHGQTALSNFDDKKWKLIYSKKKGNEVFLKYKRK